MKNLALLLTLSIATALATPAAAVTRLPTSIYPARLNIALPPVYHSMLQATIKRVDSLTPEQRAELMKAYEFPGAEWPQLTCALTMHDYDFSEVAFDQIVMEACGRPRGDRDKLLKTISDSVETAVLQGPSPGAAVAVSIVGPNASSEIKVRIQVQDAEHPVDAGYTIDQNGEFCGKTTESRNTDEQEDLFSYCTILDALEKYRVQPTTPARTENGTKTQNSAPPAPDVKSHHVDGARGIF